MSAAKHTSGPWIYDAEDNVILTHDGRVLSEWIPRSNHAKSGGTTVEERNANGRLMAAAPELLEVLQGVLKCERGMLGHLFLEGWHEDVIRAAIAKALPAPGATPGGQS